MYTQEEYLYGWLFYLLGVAILMGCGWWMTRKIKIVPLRQSIRLAALVMFLVPWYASPEMEYFAPAWIIAGFEGVFDGGEAFWRAGTPLLSSIAICLGLLLCWHAVRHLLKK